jgi:hypothetical protein
MYWQASIAIVSVAAWLQMGQVMMDCLSSHRTPFALTPPWSRDLPPAQPGYDIFSVLAHLVGERGRRRVAGPRRKVLA